MTMTKAWTKGSIRTHLGASYQTYDRLRTAMLDTVGPGGDQTRLGASLEAIAEHIQDEAGWLKSLQPLPPEMRVRPRAVYLQTYGDHLRRTAKTLTDAARVPTTPDRFEAFGVALLATMAHLQNPVI